MIGRWFANYVGLVWLVVCLTGGLALLGLMLRAIDGNSFMFCVGCQESLDKVQTEFEAGQRGYDFDAWRRAGDFRCQNAPTLRICRATPIVARSREGEPVYVARDFLSFACSTTECAWVDP